MCKRPPRRLPSLTCSDLLSFNTFLYERKIEPTPQPTIFCYVSIIDIYIGFIRLYITFLSYTTFALVIFHLYTFISKWLMLKLINIMHYSGPKDFENLNYYRLEITKIRPSGNYQGYHCSFQYSSHNLFIILRFQCHLLCP